MFTGGMHLNTLGNLLKELRSKESLRDASKRIGISHTYLDTLEKGVDKRSGSIVKPTPETLKMLAEAYNYDYEELMVRTGYIEVWEIKSDYIKKRKFNNKKLQTWYEEVLNLNEKDLDKLRRIWEIANEE